MLYEAHATAPRIRKYHFRLKRWYNRDLVVEKYFQSQFTVPWNVRILIGWKRSHDLKQPIGMHIFSKDWVLGQFKYNPITEKLNDIGTAAGSRLVFRGWHLVDAVFDEAPGSSAAILLGEVTGFLECHKMARIGFNGILNTDSSWPKQKWS